MKSYLILLCLRNKLKHFIIFLVLILSACAQPPDDRARYFPLVEGYQWDYEVTTDLINEQHIRSLSITVVSPQTLKDQSYSVRRTSEGTDYYLKADEQGVQRYGKRMLVQTKPLWDPAPQLVLPHPDQAKVGFTWSALSVPYTLHRIAPNPEPPSSQGYNFNMAYTLLSLDETITTSAGTFEHCWLVEGQAQLYVYADARKGYVDLAITNREWYAPNVGLVKLERSEPLDAEVFKGGKITMELTRFSP